MRISASSATHEPVTMHAEVGKTLFWEGDECDHVCELSHGVVRGVTISEDGERQVTAFFFAGDQIGLPVTDYYRYSAEAVTFVSYVRYARHSWRNALIESCRSDGKLLKSIGAEQDPIFRRGLLIGRIGALTRLAAFLSSLIDRLDPSPRGLVFPLLQVDIADYLALTPETVCRSLRRLREQRIIDMPAHDRLLILDPAALELTAHLGLRANP
jgi:CRP-like cAMP-binding protein